MRKNRGRNRSDVDRGGMRSIGRLQIENELRRAVDNQDFLLYYQPIVSLATGRIEMVEALIRWRHFDRGIVPPAEFVGVAEETGLIIPMGRWALAEACRQVYAWQEELGWDAPLGLSVNLSVRQFGQSDLVRMVAATLQETKLAAGSLHCKSPRAHHFAVASRREHHPRSTRVMRGHSLDDFGTGYSSLSYLHRIRWTRSRSIAPSPRDDSENLSR